VLSALVAAHQKGIVHRDLKPENIFLARRDGMRPVPKLLDFGISKGGSADDSVSDVKGLGVPLCTPYYMSPEQARGERASDPRVDLWAVGVVLYEALSGVRPFSAKNYNALLVQVASARFEPLASLRPELNRELVRVVERALAKRLEDRYPTAQAFLDAVSSFRHDEVPPSYAVPSHRGRLESKSKVADEDSNDEATTVFKRSDVQAAARAFAIKAAAERAGGAAPLTVRSAVGRSGARASAARPERTGSHAVPKAAKASSREAQEQRRPLPKIPPAPAIPRPGKQRPLPRLYETLDDETTIVDPPSFSDTTATTKVQRGDLPPRRG
jgi:serine/threonine-protein kinase